MELKSKTAIITGGGRGIGKATAMALANEGCNIVIASRSAEQLQSVADAAHALGVKALALPLDLSKPAALHELVAKTLDTFGAIDVLINNAGIIVPRPLLDVSVDEWDETINVNLRSPFLLAQRVLAHMIERRQGYIVNVSSTVALGVPKNLASYGASKAGLVGLNQALYETAKEHGVKVSCVYPGITDTQMVRDINAVEDPKEWMQPEDIAQCILFLLKLSDRIIVKDVVPWSTKRDWI